MGRIWATLGNVYRIGAIFLLLGGLFSGYGAIQRLAVAGPGDGVFQLQAASTAGAFILAIVYWLVKPVLISNRPRIIGPIVRILVAGSILVGWIVSLGLALTYYQQPGLLEVIFFGFLGQLVFLGIVYAFTGEPSSYEYAQAPTPKEPKYKAPSNFQPSGRVGPSGATVYSNAARSELAGQFDSYVPIQVLEESNGFSRVVAATGQTGWIDSRTVATL